MVTIATRRSMDPFSPCKNASSASTRKKKEKHLWSHPHHNITAFLLPSASAMETDDGGSSGDGDGGIDLESRVSGSTRTIVTTTDGTPRSENYDTEVLIKASSFGSCGGWSAGSLLDKCPASPSPICSPIDTGSPFRSPPSEAYYSQVSTELSSAPRNQSTGGKEGKKSAYSKEVREEDERREEAITDMRSSKELILPSSSSPSRPPQLKQLKVLSLERRSTPHPTRRSAEGNGHRRSRSRTAAIRSSKSMDGNDDYFGRLPAVREEQEERVPNMDNYRYLNFVSAGDSDDERSSARFENSDVESIVNNHNKLRSGCSAPPRRNRANGVEAKLMEWKKARTQKLMNELRKKESEISEWEMKKATKARMEMRKFEGKLEKKRERAMGKMESRILSAQMEAEKKKGKARASAVKKMSKVAEALDKIGSTGRLPWKLVFL